MAESCVRPKDRFALTCRSAGVNACVVAALCMAAAAFRTASGKTVDRMVERLGAIETASLALLAMFALTSCGTPPTGPGHAAVTYPTIRDGEVAPYTANCGPVPGEPGVHLANVEIVDCDGAATVARAWLNTKDQPEEWSCGPSPGTMKKVVQCFVEGRDENSADSLDELTLAPGFEIWPDLDDEAEIKDLCEANLAHKNWSPDHKLAKTQAERCVERELDVAEGLSARPIPFT